MKKVGAMFRQMMYCISCMGCCHQHSRWGKLLLSCAKWKKIFWSVPRVGTEKSALKFMVNLGKCHHSVVGRKSPKSKPKHIAKWFCVCLRSIWVTALAPWQLVLNRRRNGTISLTKKWCPKWWPHSWPWLEKNCLSQGQCYHQKWERDFLGNGTWMHWG